MGIRYHVGLAITESAFKQMFESEFKDLIDELFFGIDKPDEHIRRNTNHLFIWDDIKWSTNDKGICAFMDQLSKLNNDEYLFIKVGNDFMEHKGNYWNNDFQFGYVQIYKLYYSDYSDP
jgi:hypothetical protein